MAASRPGGAGGGSGSPTAAREGGGGGAGATYETVFTNAKAGMEGVDRERVRRVVLEASKGSAHFAREQEKNRQTEARGRALRARVVNLSASELAEAQIRADEAAAALELARDLSQTWLHVDMDAFYAAVEARDRPELLGRPFAVGGMGMISTTNYAARKFGVRSAMPGFIGKKLCPELVFVRPRFARYREAAEEVRNVLRTFDPDFLAVGLDEAYLNVTERVSKGGGGTSAAERVAEELRARVWEATGGLSCSVGGGPNRRLAKVASDINKPNGQFVLPCERAAVMEFVRTLPVRKVGGIGRVSEQLLAAAVGVRSCGELWEQRAAIQAVWTPAAAAFYLEVALGLGSSETVGEGERGGRVRKGMSCERTFRSASGWDAISKKLREVCEGLSDSLRKSGLRGQHVTLKIKTALFEVKTRCRALPAYTDCPDTVYEAAAGLLREELALHPETALRLLGVRMARFEGDGGVDRVSEGGGQLTLTQALRGGAGPEFDGKEGGGNEGEEEQPAGEAGDWGGESTYVCSLCGCTVLRSEQALHEDFHVAQELQEREDELEREQFEARQARRAKEMNSRAGGGSHGAKRRGSATTRGTNQATVKGRAAGKGGGDCTNFSVGARHRDGRRESRIFWAALRHCRQTLATAKCYKLH